MRIRSCNLENFRNIERAGLRFETDRIFLSGLNGQGKSNLLEALGLLHAVRSFRTSDLRHLIRRESSLARLYFELETKAPDPEKALVSLKRAGGREVELNGERCASLGEFLSRFPSVVLAADDVQIVRGSPGLRRRLMDLHFASSQKSYYRTLRDFTRGLAGRNRLLKESASDALIQAHDQPLSEVAATLNRARRDGTARLCPIFTTLFEEISSGQDGPGLRLQSSLQEASSGEIREAWARSLPRDRILGSTQIGPHRDDWILSTEAGAARDFASDGQQRNLAIALKLALFQDLTMQLSETPVLLADDILGELDAQRRAAFWKSIPEDCQIVATGTEFRPDELVGTWQNFRVENGQFFAV